jgi:hypothetical protein
MDMVAGPRVVVTGGAEFSGWKPQINLAEGLRGLLLA